MEGTFYRAALTLLSSGTYYKGKKFKLSRMKVFRILQLVSLSHLMGNILLPVAKGQSFGI